MLGKLMKKKGGEEAKEEETKAEDQAAPVEEAEEEEAVAEEEAAEEEAAEEEYAEGEAEEYAEGEEEEAAEEGAEEAAAEDQEASKKAASSSGLDINTSSFDELHVEAKGVQAANDAWKAFINAAENREAAGEAIYAALFDAAPSLQSLFVTPRAVQAMKFMNGLAGFVQALEDPPALKILVETLGFGHLHLDVTVPRVVIFRDAIVDILAVELGERFTSTARDAWTRLLNYVGGAIIYIKANYAIRIKTLLESWKIATEGKGDQMGDGAGSADDGGAAAAKKKLQAEEEAKKKRGGFFGKFKGNKSSTHTAEGEAGAAGEAGAEGKGGNVMSANQVPTTYNEMFKFNSAVMGFGNSMWMQEVLDCFDNIVTNVANSARLQEECDILVLRISKVAKGNVAFAEYKSCMLASLRSLLPKDWSTNHEVAWSWLWENVERILTKNMGNPPKWEKALAKILGSLDENQAFEIRKAIYNRFFALAPAGQDFFKQSNTYLHFVADRIMQMTLELYKDPVKMVDDVSALGLRHVGYAIPTEFFGPFVTACVEVLGQNTSDATTVESFRWSLGLVSKMLVRTILEGSTIVMKAINSNSVKMIKKAVSCAPRGERATWALLVQVGTQSISPLAWSIESGALQAAEAIINDLLVFRADRDRYYYGMDRLFQRHPDIVKTLCSDAPTLLPILLDGLVWRSRLTENGIRRWNCYFKHLLIDSNGKFSPTMSWIAKTRDPRLVTHPVLLLLSDVVWNKVARRAFLWRKSWFLTTLVIFIAGQAILRYSHLDNLATERLLVFLFRAFIYCFSMTQLLYVHTTKIIKSLRRKDTVKIGCIPVPKYLGDWQESAGLILTVMLIVMICLEPILWCFGGKARVEGTPPFKCPDDPEMDLCDDAAAARLLAADASAAPAKKEIYYTGETRDVTLFAQYCIAAEDNIFYYQFCTMIAMMLYYALLLDLSVMSTKLSAYVLVCIRMVSEVGLFVLALISFLLAFSCAISVLKHDQPDFAGIHKGVLSLLEMVMRMFDGKHYEMFESDPLVLVAIGFFLITATIFLINMLVAQLTCAYEAVYEDMVGYARVERMTIIVNSMPAVSEKRWKRFYESLKLDEKCEFNAGDIGVTGGYPVTEAANVNPTTQDQIKRFGGSTSVEMQWPAEVEAGDEADKFERMEQLIQKTLKRLTKSGGKGSRGGSGSGSGSHQDDEGGDEEDGGEGTGGTPSEGDDA